MNQQKGIKMLDVVCAAIVGGFLAWSIGGLIEALAEDRRWKKMMAEYGKKYPPYTSEEINKMFDKMSGQGGVQ